MTISELQTPCVIVDRVRVERNIDRMQAAATQSGIRLRPHAKTHKSPRLAHLQIARGAVGICCAKLGEAEVFARAGIGDIRLPYPLNPVNAPRVLALLDSTRLSFIVDDLPVAEEWSRAMQRAERSVEVLVKVDVGFHRCGIDPGAHDAAEVVARVARLPGLSFRGLLSHAGHAYAASSQEELAAIAKAEAALLIDLASRAAALGAPCQEISVGATPTARFSLQCHGVTEIRPGNYIYYDVMQVALGSAAWEDCALTVLARVVSRPAADRVILDSGSKTLASDSARGSDVRGYGVVFAGLDRAEPDRNLVVERLSEEHATVRVLDGGACTLAPGDLVRILPNHSCVVSNLVDRAWLASGLVVEGPLEIAARGRIT